MHIAFFSVTFYNFDLIQLVFMLTVPGTITTRKDFTAYFSAICIYSTWPTGNMRTRLLPFATVLLLVLWDTQVLAERNVQSEISEALAAIEAELDQAEKTIGVLELEEAIKDHVFNSQPHFGNAWKQRKQRILKEINLGKVFDAPPGRALRNRVKVDPKISAAKLDQMMKAVGGLLKEVSNGKIAADAESEGGDTVDSMDEVDQVLSAAEGDDAWLGSLTEAEAEDRSDTFAEAIPEGRAEAEDRSDVFAEDEMLHPEVEAEDRSDVIAEAFSEWGRAEAEAEDRSDAFAEALPERSHHEAEAEDRSDALAEKSRSRAEAEAEDRSGAVPESAQVEAEAEAEGQSTYDYTWKRAGSDGPKKSRSPLNPFSVAGKLIVAAAIVAALAIVIRRNPAPFVRLARTRGGGTRNRRASGTRYSRLKDADI